MLISVCIRGPCFPFPLNSTCPPPPPPPSPLLLGGAVATPFLSTLSKHSLLPDTLDECTLLYLCLFREVEKRREEKRREKKRKGKKRLEKRKERKERERVEASMAIYYYHY